MKPLLVVVGGLFLLLLVAAVFLYLRLRNYLARPQEGVESTVTGIAEEIESYQEKTQ